MKKIIIKVAALAALMFSAMAMQTFAAPPRENVDFIHDSAGKLRQGVTIKGGHKVALTDGNGNTIGWRDDEETVPLKDLYPVRQAIDNKEYSQSIIYPATFSYYQLDLGEIRPITKIRYLMPSDRDWYFKDAFKIELSNNPEFKDDVAIQDDVIMVYHFFTENKNEVYDEHIVDFGTVPQNYRYIRITRNDEPERDKRGIAIAELDVYGYEYISEDEEEYLLFDVLADLYISDDGNMVYANAKDGSGNILILAEYDGMGKLLNMSKVNGEETASLSCNAKSIYKAFLWTSLNEIKPVTKEIKAEK